MATLAEASAATAPRESIEAYTHVLIWNVPGNVEAAATDAFVLTRSRVATDNPTGRAAFYDIPVAIHARTLTELAALPGPTTLRMTDATRNIDDRSGHGSLRIDGPGWRYEAQTSDRHAPARFIRQYDQLLDNQANDLGGRIEFYADELATMLKPLRNSRVVRLAFDADLGTLTAHHHGSIDGPDDHGTGRGIRVTALAGRNEPAPTSNEVLVRVDGLERVLSAIGPRIAVTLGWQANPAVTTSTRMTLTHGDVKTVVCTTR